MTTSGQTPAESFGGSPNDKAGRAPDHDATEVRRHRVGAFLARPNRDTNVIAPIRHKLRAIASEGGLDKGLNAVKLLRPLVAQAHDVLRERFEADGSAEDYHLSVGRNLPMAEWRVCSTLHRFLTGCVIKAWSLHSLRWQ